MRNASLMTRATSLRASCAAECREGVRSEHTLAFHDINPPAAVHVLVIPKGAYVSWDDFWQRARTPRSRLRPGGGEMAAMVGWWSGAIACSPIPASARARRCRTSTCIFSAGSRSGRCWRAEACVPCDRGIALTEQPLGSAPNRLMEFRCLKGHLMGNLPASNRSTPSWRQPRKNRSIARSAQSS